MATPTVAGVPSAHASSVSTNFCKASAVCSTCRRPWTRPSLSTIQTSCVCDPQSIPTNHFLVLTRQILRCERLAVVSESPLYWRSWRTLPTGWTPRLPRRGASLPLARRCRCLVALPARQPRSLSCDATSPTVEAAGAVDVKNASTSSLENAKNAFPTATTVLLNAFLLVEECDVKGTRCLAEPADSVAGARCDGRRRGTPIAPQLHVTISNVTIATRPV